MEREGVREVGSEGGKEGKNFEGREGGRQARRKGVREILVKSILYHRYNTRNRIGNISRERMPLYTIHARTPYAFDKHLEGVWKSVKLLKSTAETYHVSACRCTRSTRALRMPLINTSKVSGKV